MNAMDALARLPRAPQADAAPAAPRQWRDWRDWEQAAGKLVHRFDGLFQWRSFEFEQSNVRQLGVPARLRKPYRVPVAYTDWGEADTPIVVCCGGVANTAMRFSFLAAELCATHRVICMDWLGRGRSGWLADTSEYTLETYVAQLAQLLRHLGGRPVVLLGSSMGGSVAIAFAARHPALVQRLILNDVGPYIPAARRRRRAETLDRFYVFRTPQEMMRRVGAAQKNDGPVPEDIRLYIAFHQTRWSAENGGRIYRLDPRALSAYRQQAGTSLRQWEDWRRVPCPVLLMHGTASDALSEATIARMRRSADVTVAHIPDTGHTPVLSDRHQTWWIGHWLRDPAPAPAEFSIPHAYPRWAWHRASVPQPVMEGIVGAVPGWLDPVGRLSQWINR